MPAQVKEKSFLVCEDCQEKTVIDDIGIAIYRYKVNLGNVLREESTGDLQVTTGQTRNIFIVLNTKKLAIPATGDTENELYKITCQRCQYIKHYAHKLLQKNLYIDKDDVTGICDYCRGKRQARDIRSLCDDIVTKYFFDKNSKVPDKDIKTLLQPTVEISDGETECTRMLHSRRKSAGAPVTSKTKLLPTRYNSQKLMITSFSDIADVEYPKNKYCFPKDISEEDKTLRDFKSSVESIVDIQEAEELGKNEDERLIKLSFEEIKRVTPKTDETERVVQKDKIKPILKETISKENNNLPVQEKVLTFKNNIGKQRDKKYKEKEFIKSPKEKDIKQPVKVVKDVKPPGKVVKDVKTPEKLIKDVKPPEKLVKLEKVTKDKKPTENLTESFTKAQKEKSEKDPPKADENPQQGNKDKASKEPLKGVKVEKEKPLPKLKLINILPGQNDPEKVEQIDLKVSKDEREGLETEINKFVVVEPENRDLPSTSHLKSIMAYNKVDKILKSIEQKSVLGGFKMNEVVIAPKVNTSIYSTAEPSAKPAEPPNLPEKPRKYRILKIGDSGPYFEALPKIIPTEASELDKEIYRQVMSGQLNREKYTKLPQNDLELNLESMYNKEIKEAWSNDIIHGNEIAHNSIFNEEVNDEQPMLSVTTLNEIPTVEDFLEQKEQTNNMEKDNRQVLCYSLSDRSSIDNGWTMLPTEKINLHRMRAARPEFDWFKHNKSKGYMTYDTGEKLAEFEDDGRGRCYYRNGRLALNYYDAEENNAQQRYVVYSSGEPDKRGRSRPITVLAMFDFLGNGIVFDHNGKIRLKYNQIEGVVLDRSLGPVTHWQWHSSNDPPVLQQVMIDTHIASKDPPILKLKKFEENHKSCRGDEQILDIELENLVKEKAKKMSSPFHPYQIKMKALEINEQFSLRIIDQATIYLVFQDGSLHLKLNLGMILDRQEIVDTETVEVGEVPSSLETVPVQSDSVEELRRRLDVVQHRERMRSMLEQRIRSPVPRTTESADQMAATTSHPLHSTNGNVPSLNRYQRRKPTNFLYYDARLI